MPALPTLTVTQAQADRILAAFGTIQAYKEWLKENVIGFVVAYEARAAQDNLIAEKETKTSELNNSITTT